MVLSDAIAARSGSLIMFTWESMGQASDVTKDGGSRGTGPTRPRTTGLVSLPAYAIDEMWLTTYTATVRCMKNRAWYNFHTNFVQKMKKMKVFQWNSWVSKLLNHTHHPLWLHSFKGTVPSSCYPAPAAGRFGARNSHYRLCAASTTSAAMRRASQTPRDTDQWGQTTWLRGGARFCTRHKSYTRQRIGSATPVHNGVVAIRSTS